MNLFLQILPFLTCNHGLLWCHLTAYGELYRKFGISSYKLLPASKFEDAMKWLAEWYQLLTNTSLPF